MTLPKERGTEAIRIALRGARENEAMWMELSPEFPADGARMAHWARTAKLRRIEVERIEALLIEAATLSPDTTLPFRQHRR